MTPLVPIAVTVAVVTVLVLLIPALRGWQLLFSRMTLSSHQKILSLAVVLFIFIGAGFGIYRLMEMTDTAEPLVLQGTSHDVDAMLSALEKKLEKNPGDAEGWYVLGRSYAALSDGKKSEAAFAKAVALAPHEAKMLSYYAEALAMNAGGNLQGAARPWIEKALAADSQEEKSLELAGLAAFQREEFETAINFWRQLLKRLPVNSEFYEGIQEAIKKAEEQSHHLLNTK